MVISKKFINPLRNAHKSEIELVFDEDSKEPVSHSLKSGRVWSEELAAISSLFWHKDSVLVDIGCHIGTFSTLAASFTKGKVFSIEPEPSNFEFLHNNKVINGFDHQICLNIAASDKEETIKFCTNGPSSHVLEEGGTEPYVEVQGKPLDLIFADEPIIDFIKLDVEGWEINALKGMRKTIKRCQPVIVFEVNGFTLKWFDKTPNDLLRHLESEFDYQIFVISPNNTLIPISSYEPFPYGVVDCIALHKHNLSAVQKLITLPLTFSERRSIQGQTYFYGNSDIKSYLDWYSNKIKN